jgi:uncharacterized protein (TIGR03083 family)
VSDNPPIARLYLDAHRSFVALARTLEPDDWTAPVACCPGWTVRDVLSHVAGLADDIVNGRVEGAATEPWTAAQVERWRDAPVDELISQWEQQAPGVADALELIGESRPPIDCCTHEHDVRAALGRPGGRDSDVVRFATAALERVDSPVPVEVELTDGRRSAFTSVEAEHDLENPHDRISVRGLDAFELFRSRLGRRSADQVRRYDWSEPPSDEVLDAWFFFGPSPVDIVE